MITAASPRPSTDDPRDGRGVAASRRRGIHVIAAASPRPVRTRSASSPRRESPRSRHAGAGRRFAARRPAAVARGRRRRRTRRRDPVGGRALFPRCPSKRASGPNRSTARRRFLLPPLVEIAPASKGCAAIACRRKGRPASDDRPSRCRRGVAVASPWRRRGVAVASRPTDSRAAATVSFETLSTKLGRPNARSQRTTELSQTARRTNGLSCLARV